MDGRRGQNETNTPHACVCPACLFLFSLYFYVVFFVFIHRVLCTLCHHRGCAGTKQRRKGEKRKRKRGKETDGQASLSSWVRPSFSFLFLFSSLCVLRLTKTREVHSAVDLPLRLFDDIRLGLLECLNVPIVVKIRGAFLCLFTLRFHGIHPFRKNRPSP